MRGDSGQPKAVRTASLGSAAGTAALTSAAGRSPAAAASAFTSMSEPGHVAYRVGPLDVLEISVFRVPELSAVVQVADTGTINLPLIGEVPASSRTAQEIEQDVTARLGADYLQKPQVTVFIKEYNARRVTVDGSVRKPGVYPLRGRTSLLQVITMAEGLDYNRASSDVVVFRQQDGKRKAARFDLDAIRAGTANDPLMEPGDVVIVDDSAAKIVLLNILRVIPVTNVFMGVL
ncbi:MAG: polysaccharide export protein [Hyphomicrobiaceae bacterium]|nr:polysaccharide export protein [Hyphomicrobiaceae bacterium]